MIDYSKIENIPERTKVDVILGNVELMPKREEIPKEFFNSNNKWNNLFGQIFYRGGENLQFQMKETTSKEDFHKALYFIRAIMTSFEPEHNHKAAACAYLFSLYLDDWSIKEEVTHGS